MKATIIAEHPSVCTVLEIRTFGELSPSINDGKYTGYAWDHAEDIEEFKEHLRYCVTQHNKKYSALSEDNWANKSVHRVAIIVAYTASCQPKAAEYLTELGFNTSGPLKKAKHAHTDLIMWWTTPSEFLARIEWKAD